MEVHIKIRYQRRNVKIDICGSSKHFLVKIAKRPCKNADGWQKTPAFITDPLPYSFLYNRRRRALKYQFLSGTG
jgi:hypothetical protein